MKIKAIDGLQFALGLAMVAAGANKVPGADVLTRQLDLIGLALFYRLRLNVRTVLKRARCFVGAGFGITAVLASSIVVATTAQNMHLGAYLLAAVAMVTLGETVVWARLRRLADDAYGAGATELLTQPACCRS